jgi:hypothetical protein
LIDAKALQWLTDHQQHDDDAVDPILAAGITFPIPINAYLVHGPYGQMSYPNYGSPSRSLQYPDLHLLHRACDAANVACGHVYLHRDPYDIMGTKTTQQKSCRTFYTATLALDDPFSKLLTSLICFVSLAHTHKLFQKNN